MKQRVLLGMGSNIDPEQHLQQAAAVLRNDDQQLQCSHVYRSKAVGMEADDFLNACCFFSTDMPLESLNTWLKSIEDTHGRDRSCGAWQSRTLDLDILMFDDAVVSDDLYRYAHVFVPASELISLPERPVFTSRLERMSLGL